MNMKSFTLFLTFTIGFLGATTWRLWEKNTLLKRDLSYYQSTYLRKQGGTSLWPGSHGNMFMYDLRSFDGGRSWYAVKSKDNVLIVLNEAETIYPGLLNSLAALDEVTTKVTANGPLKLSDPNDRKLLEGAGFQVITNH